MNEMPALAAEYEALKRSLWKVYEHNCDGYTEVKGAFVRACTQKAKEAYNGRYA